MISAETIRHWISLAAQLKSVKEQEMSVRKEINNDILGVNKVGTSHMAMHHIEVTCTVTEKLETKKEDVMSVMEELTDAEKECIIWKPSIQKALYDKLPEDAILRTVVTAKPNAPKVTAVDTEVK